MTASVNAIAPPDNAAQLDSILRAVNIAVNSYGQKLDRDQAKQIADAADQRQRDINEAARGEQNISHGLSVIQNLEQVPENSPGAIPRSSIQNILPRGMTLPPEGFTYRSREISKNEAAAQQHQNELAQKMAISQAELASKEKIAGMEAMSKKDALMAQGAKENQTQKAQNQDFAGRYQNLQQNADKLKTLVNKYGTFEAFGPQGKEMDGLLYEMAIDYAKLVDPSSVAREGEVAAAQKYLLPIREYAGLGTSNSTAVSLIDNYKKQLDQRLSSRQQGQTEGLATSPGGLGGQVVSGPSADAIVAELQRRSKSKSSTAQMGK